jgi:hypothetical protein
LGVSSWWWYRLHALCSSKCGRSNRSDKNKFHQGP